MSKPTGGPAFPVPGLQDDESFNGMTLRDYFAAKAMAAIISGCMADGLDYPNRDGAAIHAYAYADSMLDARVKP